MIERNNQRTSKCRGCTAPATQPITDRVKLYCEQCWSRRTNQLRQEERRFDFWRIIRSSEAELWGIRCPKDEENAGEVKVGEAWILFDNGLKRLVMHLYLSPHLDWKRRVVVLLAEGITAEESRLDILTSRVLAFFEASFPCESWSLTVGLLAGEQIYREGESE